MLTTTQSMLAAAGNWEPLTYAEWSEMDQQQPWALGSSVDDGSFHSLVQVRELSPAETEEINGALRLLWWVTRGSQWNSVLSAWNEYLEIEPKSVGDLGVANQSVFRLLRALTRFSKQLESVPPEHGPIARSFSQQDPSGWLSRSSEMSARAPAEPPELVVVRVHESRPGVRTKSVHLSPAAADWLGDLASLDVSARIALEGAVGVAQWHHANLLVSFSEAIVAASLVLKRFAAEVALGRPIVLRLNRVEGTSQTYDIRDFALEDIARLSIALERAKQLVGQRESQRESATVEPASGKGSRTEADPPNSRPHSVSQERPSTSPDWSAIDPVGLFLQTRRLTDEMEIRWSDSLSEVLSDDAITSALAQWHSLLIAESGALSGPDADVQVSWPPTTASLIDEDALDAQAKTALGYVAALIHLTQTLKAIEVPTNRDLTLDGKSATLRHWWSSGGFSVVRSSAHMLLRTAQEIGNSLSADNEGRVGIGIPRQLQSSWPELWLESAQRAMDAGLPESTLIYCCYAYDSWSDRPAPLQPARRQAALLEFERLVPRIRQLVASIAGAPQTSIELLPTAMLALDALTVAITSRQIVVNVENVDPA